ncbi:MAG: serine hydrolase domain-containing protein [Gemmatimonadales bacterium]
MQQGIDAGLYPGAVVVIGRRDTILYAQGYGRPTWSARGSAPQPDSTVWDIASITKVVATASSAMRLAAAGRLTLDAPVSRYLPRFKGARKERVTVRMLLDHTSGLPPYLPLYRLARSRSRALDRLYAEPLQRMPGDSAVYSDLNAMLLGFIVEKVAGRSLAEVAEREVFRPLEMRRTMFRPPARLLPWIAPSGMHRGRAVRGRVNDENAVRLGGVAGHAGVFSTGGDLARYAQTWLRSGAAPGGTWVAPEMIRQFLTPGSRSGTRLLGWDTRDPLATPDAPSVFGSLVSASTYGHTGWTGTELWVDPARDLFLVFLTNRSFDPQTSQSVEKLKLVRADVSDAAARLVPPVCVQELVAVC